MEKELQQKIEDLQSKVDQMYKLAMTVKKMFIWSMILSLLFFVIPLIILIFMLPSMINTISGAYSGLL
ncbi:hypothetical protein KKH39_03805 [Patescibacteria group bacterium]|nr:hypothetical protein [Patescibacteria group bacterium]